MSNPRQKIDRSAGVEHTAQCRHEDSLDLWPGINHDFTGRYNLSLKDQNGDNVVTLYGVNPGQMAALYAEIGAALGLPSSATIEHLRRLLAHLQGLFPAEAAHAAGEPAPAARGG